MTAEQYLYFEKNFQKILTIAKLCAITKGFLF